MRDHTLDLLACQWQGGWRKQRVPLLPYVLLKIMPLFNISVTRIAKEIQKVYQQHACSCIWWICFWVSVDGKGGEVKGEHPADTMSFHGVISNDTMNRSCLSGFWSSKVFGDIQDILRIFFLYDLSSLFVLVIPSFTAHDLWLNCSDKKMWPKATKMEHSHFTFRICSKI